jgi:hypothetical protein
MSLNPGLKTLQFIGGLVQINMEKLPRSAKNIETQIVNSDQLELITDRVVAAAKLPGIPSELRQEALDKIIAAFEIMGISPSVHPESNDQ